MTRKIILFVVLIASIFLEFGCKKEIFIKRTRPQIIVEADPFGVLDGKINAAIEKDTAISVKYTIVTEESIGTLKQTIAGVDSTIISAQGQKTFTYTMRVPLKYNSPGQILIKMFVSDNNNQLLLVENFVVVTKKDLGATARPFILYPSKLLGGDISAAASRINLDKGSPHGGGAINADPALIPLIDLFYNEGKIRNNDGSGRWPSSMGSKFATTTFTEAEFNSMKDDSRISSTTGNIDELIVSTLVGKVVYFQTSLGNKGLILIKNYNAGNDEITIDIKVTPTRAVVLYPNKLIGGDISAAPSRFNLDLGNGHSGGSVNGDPTLIPLIDIFYNEGKVSNNDGSGRWPNGMGSKFATTTYTEAQFNATTNDVQINALTGNLDELVITGLAGKVFFFQTNTGNKGLILVKNYSSANDEMTFDIRVTQ
jgi:hypothetical protein